MSFFNLNNPELYIGIAFAIVNAILLCFASSKFLQIIQLSGYKISGYRVWLADTHAKYISRLAMLSFISFSCMLITVVIFDAYLGYASYLAYIGFAFYLFFLIYFICNMYIAPQKTPLKTTYRMNRLIACLFTIIAIVSFILFWISTTYLPLYVPYIRFSVVALTPLLLPLLVPLAHFIMLGYEILNHKKFISWAKKKLKKYPDLIKIGITGSVGKTSTKFILNSILSEKYNVCMTPHSFNTPMGLTKVVLDYLKPSHEVLITEMGAKQPGEIQALCDIIKPKYGILTLVGSQHLATFGSLENIAKTKNELINSLPTDGIAIFNGDNEPSIKLYEKCKIEKCLITTKECESSFAYAKDVVLNERGINFTLCIDNKNISCKTKLIGMHNLKNILLCSALAYKLGLSLEQIKIGISKLEPINHRLELKKENGLIILDDSFNSSVEGSNSALECLKMFKTGKKIIVTPGLVELGQLEKESNFNFGAKIAETCDEVIIVNKVNKNSITEGLLSEGFSEEKISFATNLLEAKLKLKDIAKKGDVILFENDLPDNYT